MVLQEVRHPGPPRMHTPEEQEGLPRGGTRGNHHEATTEGSCSLERSSLGSGGEDGAGAKGPGTPHGGPTDRHAWGDAFILAITRFQAGCSARFNDLQHVHPQKLSQTSQTLELQGPRRSRIGPTRRWRRSTDDYEWELPPNSNIGDSAPHRILG